MEGALLARPDGYVLGNIRAVLPDRILDDARIAVRDGLIHEVGPGRPGAAADVDGRGLVCLPGLVDVHSDSLTRECRPRPGAAMPIDFALRAVESTLLAAGITTAYHGAAFQARTPVGTPIGAPAAVDVAEAVRSAPPGRVDHRTLHRLDIRCPAGVADLRRWLGTLPGGGALVSHEDHTPGQGQYADPATMRRWLVEAESMTPERAAAHVAELTADRDRRLDVRDRTLAWLGELARQPDPAGRIRLAGHDPATVEEVAALAARGGAVAEFPTTVAAAAAARRHGLYVVAGAPNVLRGGSHAGNVSAAELVAGGLVDALASDYLPSALLAAVTELVRLGLAALPAAVRLVTSGPAAAAGLTDRGSLVAGQRADLVLADLSGRWPRAVATL